MQEIITGEKYRHYKGNIYRVIGIGKHSETLENVVIYQSDKTSDIWVRPMSMWNEIIDNNETLRFTKIED